MQNYKLTLKDINPKLDREVRQLKRNKEIEKLEKLNQQKREILGWVNKSNYNEK